MTTNELIRLFFDRNERAIEETQKQYGDYCFTVANNILCNEQDAEECVNDTYLRLWNSIPPAQPKNFTAYIAKIARNLSVNMLKARKAGKRDAQIVAFDELEATLFAPGDEIAEGVALSELQAAINRFLHTCPERDRALFIRRYFFCERTEYIAEKFSISYANATKILARMREKLKEHLRKEGYYL